MRKMGKLSFSLIWIDVLVISITIGGILLFSHIHTEKQIPTKHNIEINPTVVDTLQIENWSFVHDRSYVHDRKLLKHSDSLYPDSLQRSIYSAIDKRNYQFFQDFVRNEKDLEKRIHPIFQYTILMWLAKDTFMNPEKIEFVKKMIALLLEKGADIEAYDNSGRTVLFHALNYEIVEFLIQNGATIEARDNNNSTALLESRSWEKAKLLIRYGADINARNNWNSSFLMNHITLSDKERIDYVIRRSANLFAKTNNGKNILMHSRKAKITEYLVKLGLDVNATDNSGKSALHHAIESKSREIDNIVMLLNLGAAINVLDKKGKSPLIYAIRKNQEDTTQLLIEKGANFEINEILFEFAKARHLNRFLANYLIGQNVDFDYQDAEGKTPLFYAGKEVMNFLIEQKVDINKLDKKGRSAIFYAVGFPPNHYAIKLLVVSGADLKIVDYSGKSLIDVAHETLDSKTIDFLIENGAR